MKQIGVGTRIGTWEVVRPLGAGGTGQVLEVRDAAGRPGALKVLHQPADRALARLRREARALAELDHPGIVRLLDMIEDDEQCFLVMELVRGPTLSGWSGGIDEVLAMFLQILDAVGAAHDAGWVHRDLKPSNVLIAPDGTPRVADFGLARLVATSSPDLTHTRGFLGTPAYMAPEQVRDARQVDARADVFSLGAILYGLVCGRPPFARSEPLAVLEQAARGAYADPHQLRPDLPDALVAALHGALEPDPGLRIADCPSLRDVVTGTVPWRPAARGSSTVTWEPDEPPELPPGEPPIGRDAVLARIRDLTARHGLVTVVGPGGVGKTTVVRAAVDGQRSVIWVDLTAANGADDVVLTVARALGLPADGDVAAVSERVAGALARRPAATVVLDSLDPAVSSASDTVARWVGASRDVHLLATSREALSVADEVVVPLGPLDRDAATALLRRRTGSRDAPWDELAAAVDDLPLALELVAEAIDEVGPERALDELARYRRTSGDPRHASLGTVLDASVARLDALERAAWPRLSVFRGGFRPEMAATVLDLPADTAQRVLGSLRAKHLLVSSPSPYAPRATRLGMYRHVREHAQSLLTPPEREAALDRLVDWAVTMGARAAIEATPRTGGDRRVRAAIAELANLETALEHARAGDSADRHAAVAIALGEASERGGTTARAAEITGEALARATDPWQRATLARMRAWFLRNLGQAEEARALLEAAVPGPDLLTTSWNCNMLGVLNGMGRLDQALGWFERALREAPDGEPAHRGRALRNLAAVHAHRGHLDQARTLAEEALALLREEGSELDQAAAEGLLAMILQRLGDDEGALRGMRAELLTLRRLGHRAREAGAAFEIARLLGARGDHAEAEAAARRSLRLLREIGVIRLEAHARIVLAEILLAQGDPDGAENEARVALEATEEDGSPTHIGMALHLLASIEDQRGHLDVALGLVRDSVSHDRSLRSSAMLVRLACATGDLQQARAEADALLEQIREGSIRDRLFARAELGSAFAAGGAPGPASEHLAWIDAQRPPELQDAPLDAAVTALREALAPPE